MAPGTRLLPSDLLRFRCISDALPGLWRAEGLAANHQSGRLGGDRFRHTLVEVALSRRCFSELCGIETDAQKSCFMR